MTPSHKERGLDLQKTDASCELSLLKTPRPRSAQDDAALPGVRNGAGFARLHAGKGRPIDRRLARIALVLDLSLLVQGHHGHRLFPHGIMGILIDHDKDLGRAGLHAVSTAVALIRVNGDEILA